MVALVWVGLSGCGGKKTQTPMLDGSVDTSEDTHQADVDEDSGLSNAFVVEQLSLGARHSCAVSTTGKVRCWGSGELGRLGLGNTDNVGDVNLPYASDTISLNAEAVSIAAGGAHTCALVEGPKVQCWGNNASGQLARHDTEAIGDDEVPLNQGFADILDISSRVVTGTDHTCVLRSDGRVLCWGRGAEGQLGLGNTDTLGDDEDDELFHEVALMEIVDDVSAGHQHTCAVLQTGIVSCWGRGTEGQLGYGNTDNLADDEPFVGMANETLRGLVSRVTAGYSHTCVLFLDGEVSCWGSNGHGELGYGNTDAIGDDEDLCLPIDPELCAPPEEVDAGAEPCCAPRLVSLGEMATQVVAGREFTCALLESGDVRCWGNGADGRLGYGNTDNIGDDSGEVPSSVGVVDVGGKVARLAAGESHVCALLESGDVRCWGNGADGRLGYGNTDNIGDDSGEVPSSVGPVQLEPPAP